MSEVKRLAEKYLAPIPAQPAADPVHLVEGPQTGERRIMVQKQVANPYLSIAYHVPQATHPDFYALDLLSSILTSGKSSRLYSSLVNTQQLASSIFAGFGETFDPGIFTVTAATNKGKSVQELENAIYTELDKIKNDGVTDMELQKVKNQKLIAFYDQIETINGKSDNLGTYEVFFGDFKKMFDAPAEYNKVTSQDIKRVASKYMTKPNRTVGIVQTNTAD